MKYTIEYSGWTTLEVEAVSKDDAVSKFWEDGLNELYDAEIQEVEETT